MKDESVEYAVLLSCYYLESVCGDSVSITTSSMFQPCNRTLVQVLSEELQT